MQRPSRKTPDHPAVFHSDSVNDYIQSILDYYSYRPRINPAKVIPEEQNELDFQNILASLRNRPRLPNNPSCPAIAYDKRD